MTMVSNSVPFPLNHPHEWDPDQTKLWRDRGVISPLQLARYGFDPVTMISGSPGGGLSTTLDLIRAREEACGNFVVAWQAGENVWFSLFRSISNALERVMARRAQSTQEGSILDETMQTVWFWLLETYCFQSNRLMTRRWFHRYFGTINTTLEETFIPDLATLAPGFVVDLLLDVVGSLGYQDIVCICENPVPEIPWQVFLPMIEAEARGLRVVLGTTAATQAFHQATACFPHIRLTWTWGILWQICHRLVNAALAQPVEIPRSLIPPLQTLVQEELGPTPQAMKTLATSFYWLTQRHGCIPPDPDVVKRDLYERSIPLRYDPTKRVIFRGTRPLSSLTTAPLQLFEYLYFRRGQIIDTTELLGNACVGSSDNLHQLIRRIRATIEPFASYKERDRWVYLSNHHTIGFTLENCL